MKKKAIALVVFLYAFLFLAYVPSPFDVRSVEDPLAEYKFSEMSIEPDVVSKSIQQLRETFGKNKSYPEIYEPQFLAALSFYPELINTNIRIKSKVLKTSMAVRPTSFNALGRNRVYTIFVDDISEKGIDFRKSSFSAQVGCMIHELGHVAHYESEANAALIYEGIKYLASTNFRSSYEKQTDHVAARHGGGYYTYEYARFIFKEADVDPDYLEYKRTHYYSDEDLLEIHDRYDLE